MSDWLYNMSRTDALEFEYEALFGVKRLRDDFWSLQDLENDPRWKDHPVKGRASFMDKAIVINFHGDGAQFHDNDSLMTVSFSGALKEGSTLDTNLLLASWPKYHCASHEGGTWDTLWAWIVWDINQLYANTYQHSDPWGGPLPAHLQERAGQAILPDDYFVVVNAVCSDLDFAQVDLGLPNKGCVDPNPCCGYCHGNKTDNNWFNFQEDAPWKTSAPRDPYTTHVIAKIVGLTVWHFMIDVLHTGDHGVASHAVANVLHDTIFQKLRHESRGRAVQIVAEHLMANAPEHGSALTHFELKMFINPKKLYAEYPLIAQLKAAQVRGMIPAVAELAEKYSTGSREDRHRVRMMNSLATVYEIMHNSGIAIPRAEYDRMKKAADVFLLTYNWLSENARHNNVVMFNVVPKFHYFFHMIQQARFTNPRFVWTYGGDPPPISADKLMMWGPLPPVLIPDQLISGLVKQYHTFRST
jgi:hypothetical protein